MSVLNVFISYSSSNKELAGELKRFLNKYGLNVFLAHETINPTEEWQNKILEYLEKMDVFILLLTKKYQGSKWTDQESGYAISRRILIIPIKVDINPYGFLSKIQAIVLNKNDQSITYNKIIEILYNKEKIKFLNSIIDFFGKSPDFDTSNQRVKIINEFSGYSIKQMNKILEVSSKNHQIYNAFKAINMLKNLINLNRDELDKDLIKEIESKL